MTNVIIAPNPFDTSGYKVYLAGAIDMGDAVNWQKQVIKALANNTGLVLLNPRRAKFTKETIDQQINWELHAMESADAILMWFPKEAEAPISFLETGLYLQSGKLVLGAEKGFFRRRNLELTTEFYKVKLWGHLDELVAEILRLYIASKKST